MNFDTWKSTEPDPYLYDVREIDWDDWDEDPCEDINGEPESLPTELQIDPKVTA